MDRETNFIDLFDMYEKIRKLKKTNIITNEKPYCLKINKLTYLYLYIHPGNIYLLTDRVTKPMNKEEALEMLRQYFRKYKLDKIKL